VRFQKYRCFWCILVQTNLLSYSTGRGNAVLLPEKVRGRSLQLCIVVRSVEWSKASGVGWSGRSCWRGVESSHSTQTSCWCRHSVLITISQLLTSNIWVAILKAWWTHYLLLGLILWLQREAVSSIPRGSSKKYDCEACVLHMAGLQFWNKQQSKRLNIWRVQMQKPLSAIWNFLLEWSFLSSLYI